MHNHVFGNELISMNTYYMVWGGIVPLFLLGLLIWCVLVASVRRGEIIAKGGRWVRGHDVWGFWFMAAFLGISGVSTMVGAVWMGLRVLGFLE